MDIGKPRTMLHIHLSQHTRKIVTKNTSKEEFISMLETIREFVDNVVKAVDNIKWDAKDLKTNKTEN